MLCAKVFGNSEDIPVDQITPTRFSMIISMASAAIYSKIKDNKQIDLLKALYRTIINPLAVFHGFTPMEEPQSFTDTAGRMMFYYL